MSDNLVENNENQQPKNGIVEDLTNRESNEDKNYAKELEKYKTAFNEEKVKVSMLEKLLTASIEERDVLKTQCAKAQQNCASGKSSKNAKKQDFNDMMTQAKSVIFEKTKVCKNQELQIEALKQQVASLKEIVAISKDMLDIRNMEVQQLQEKMNCLELKFAAEKDRQGFMNTKLDKMVKLNSSLKEEYQKQLGLFTALQNAYHTKLNQSKSNEEQVNNPS